MTPEGAKVPQASRAAWPVRLTLAGVFLAAGSTFPQAQSSTASIEGVAVDQSGAVLAGVAVVLLQPATGVERTLATNAEGRFRAPLLPVGVYEVTAARAGFRSWKHADIRLSLGQTVTLRIELAVAGVASAITVSGAPPLLETSQSHASSHVNELAVQGLPINGRNFIDFVLLTPGVTRDERAGDVSFAGQRGSLNSLVVDGADNNNTFSGQALGRAGSGRAPYQFSQDAVREFQVNSNAFSAEYGRAGAGVINVVTRSGTNAVQGTAFEFYRDRALNATNAINKLNNLPKSAYHYHQFGGTLGGPFRLNRDFYFFNVDGQRNTQPNVVVLNLPPGTPGDAATLAGIERLRPLAFGWSRRLDQNVVFIKTDHQIGQRHRLTVRYNHQDFTGEGYENGGPQNALEHSGDSRVMTRTLNASWAGVFGSSRFNEMRVQYARDQEPGDANSENPEAIVQQSGAIVLLIGRNNFSPREMTIDRLQAADTFTWIRGTHKVKAGFDLQFDRIRNYFPRFFSGSYVFRSLASFAAGRPDGPNEFYQQSFPGPGTTGPETRPDTAEYSLFVQDEWKPRPDVTLNLGLRYDLMKTRAPGVRNPAPELAAAGIDTGRFDPDPNNLGPRLGIAWNPDTRPFVLRGGLGVFYGRTPSIRLAAAGNNGVNVVSVTFRGGAVPTYPQKFETMPTGGVAARPDIFYLDKDYANPRVVQANAAVQWALFAHSTVTATYLFVDGNTLPRASDRNLGTLTSRSFTIAGSSDVVTYPFFGSDRPFSSFQRVIALASSAESRYHGLAVELHRRFSNDTHLRLAYTLGKVVDTVPDANFDDFTFASHPLDFEVDRAAGNNDQRHRFVASGVYTSNRWAQTLDGVARLLARNWSVGAIVTLESGKPYTARVGGIDINGDGNNRNDIAPGTRRNEFRLAALVTCDLRVARDIRLVGRARAQLIWEAFNLFNRDNINAVNTLYYTVAGTTLSPSGTFGRPTGSAGERIMQLAVKVRF